MHTKPLPFSVYAQGADVAVDASGRVSVHREIDGIDYPPALDVADMLDEGLLPYDAFQSVIDRYSLTIDALGHFTA